MWIDYTDQDFEGYFIDSDGKIINLYYMIFIYKFCSGENESLLNGTRL